MNDELQDDSRMIPRADLRSFHAPEASDNFILKQRDAVMINKLREEFMSTGVIERVVPERSAQSSVELNMIMREAAENAKYERELNPEYYDAELDASLQGDLSFEEDWDNPILDGVDDYGEQFFIDHRSSPPSP